MESTLKFLTGDDERLLMERAEVHRFERNQPILEEGSHRTALFVMARGAARVERAHFGRGVAYGRLGPGARRACDQGPEAGRRAGARARHRRLHRALRGASRP